jgi:hypothetical protein
MNYLYITLKSPTRLYIKRCPHCGLKYFGKSIKEDIESYRGSGKIWTRHLDKHKVKPEHLWNSDWYKDTSITRFALKFSKINRIVNSKEWANLMEENGIDGGPQCRDTYDKISKKTSGVPRKWSEETMKNHHEKIRSGKIINPHTKRWRITDPDGNIHVVDNLSIFCKERKISQGNLSAWGETKGYSAICIGYTRELEVANIGE